ncbi:unnamed protein product [Blepharisma stoltei]|uniref:HMG box domain-containing protein n=1 Tax=Blepharisma stoltei TaxID=1481888 RepID=A0AAU9KCV9_9CILI|nr:unnamed protein product [Blepharisma stoltei]
MAKQGGKAKAAKKQKRVKKDKSGPKKPKSAFMFFSQDRRQTLKTEQPDLKITEQSKVIGKEWGELTDAEKAPYQEKANQDRERYNKEKASSPKEEEKKEEPEGDEEDEESED